MRTLVVAGTPRSGTNMTGSILANLGIGRSGEFCEPKVADRLCAEWGIGPDRYRDELHARRCAGGWFVTQAHPDHDLSVAVESVDLWVLVTRRDVVAQAVSWDLAAQTGNWYDDPTTGGEYRPDRIAERVACIVDGNARWEDEIDGPAWRVTYEDLPAGFASTRRQATDRNREMIDRYRREHQ